MFYANEVRSAPYLKLATKFSNKELSMAVALIKGYEGVFDPAQFKDLYQERVKKIIDAAVNNLGETKPAPATRAEATPDIMEQIRLSLAQLESKKRDAKKPAYKTPTFAKKKPEKVRA
jgi:DNA end-binding protein Ku